MGSLNHSTVQDLRDANVAVDRLKAEPFLEVKLPHIPIHQVRWATVQDASLANAAEDHSQGAYLVGATSQDCATTSHHCRNSDHVRGLGRRRVDSWSSKS